MTRSRIVLVVTIVVISAFLYLMIRHKRLGNYLGLVERTFADEIALIEQKCIEHPTEYDETRFDWIDETEACLLYTSPSPRDQRGSRMPSSA